VSYEQALPRFDVDITVWVQTLWFLISVR